MRTSKSSKFNNDMAIISGKNSRDKSIFEKYFFFLEMDPKNICFFYPITYDKSTQDQQEMMINFKPAKFWFFSINLKTRLLYRFGFLYYYLFYYFHLPLKEYNFFRH